MLLRAGTVHRVPVISRVGLVAVGLLASLALSQTACHASGRGHEAREARADVVDIAKPVVADPSSNPAAAGPEPHTENARGASGATAAAMPVPIRGTWQMGDAPCDVPHPDSDGTLTITSEGWQGYEYYGSPVSVESVAPDEWVIEGDESYEGSQHDHVRKQFALRGGLLTISEADYVERYSRCRGR